MLVGPGAVRENEVGAAARERVEQREEAVVAASEASARRAQLLGGGEERVGGDQRVVVELRLAKRHAAKHVAADRWVVRVGQHARRGEQLHHRVGEGQARCVHEEIRNELAQTLQRQRHRRQRLEKHREVRVVVRLQPTALRETHELKVERGTDVDVQDLLRFTYARDNSYLRRFQNLLRGTGVARVDHAVDGLESLR